MDSRDRFIALLTTLTMLACFAASLYGMVALEPPSGSDPLLASTRFRASVEQYLHSAAGVFLSIALLCVIDLVLLPWLSLHDVARGTGEWRDRHYAVRAAAILAWATLAWAIITGITRANLAL